MPFLEQLVPQVTQFLKEAGRFVLDLVYAWWWVPLPFLIYPRYKKYRDWYHQEKKAKKREFVILRVYFPREIPRPLRAMEEALKVLVPVASGGKIFPVLSLEIVSVGGEVSFLIRVIKEHKDTVKTALFSQFEGVSIEEVSDYTSLFPVPLTEDWKMIGKEFILDKDDPYPILTYRDFETGKESKETKRLDPLSELIEGMTLMKEGEILGLQIVLNNHEMKKEFKFEDKAKEVFNKIMGRKEEKKKEEVYSVALRAFKEALLEILGMEKGGGKEEKKEEKQQAPQLSPREKEILEKIERKRSNPYINSTVRAFYLAKAQSFLKERFAIVSGFLNSLGDAQSNKFKGLKETDFVEYKSSVTKKLEKLAKAILAKPPSRYPSSFYDDMIKKERSHAFLERVVRRLTPLYPEKGGTSILGVEELATLWHFPSFSAAPLEKLSRAEFKVREAPPELPVVE